MVKLLLIEDDALLRVTTLDLLQIEDFEVIVAENGVDGVRLAQEHQPDLVISDILMPEMDGFQVLRTLREQPLTANIPFVFVTAKAEKLDISSGKAAGADEYLVKPFTSVALLETIETCLQKRTQLSRSRN